MTDETINGFVKIIRAGLEGTKVDLPEQFNLDSLYSFANSHQIVGLVYYGALAAGISSDIPIMQKLYISAVTELIIHERQARTLSLISEALDLHKINYMPLKGSAVKKLYPRPEMRVMSDIDILINYNDYDKIRSIMVSFGANELYESNHEIVWKTADGVTIEFHKMLIPSYNDKYYNYFKSGWEFAEKDENSYSHHMRPEDEFVYIFTHLSKHYRGGGIGVKQLCDVWLYLKTHDLDFSYIEKTLNELELLLFYNNIVNTLSVWFDDAKPNDITDLITNTIISYGAFGTKETKRKSYVVRNAAGKKNVKFAKFLLLRSKIFPSARFIDFKYKFLIKHPYLLPVAWVMRWFNVLFNKRSAFARVIKDFNVIDSDATVKFEEELHRVGLNFNLEEKS